MVDLREDIFSLYPVYAHAIGANSLGKFVM